jgi:hypothetical protein
MRPAAVRFADTISIIALAYWGVAALVFPVTIWDAHTYNLARVSIAEMDGLFGNALWLNDRQIFFPWTFDALHVPFLHIGWGYGIPSFLCLLSILYVVRRLLTEFVSKEAASVAVLTLLSMPTLVFQATSPKNDLPVVFGAVVWFFAVIRHRQTHARVWLYWMALALAFAAGAKSAGLALAGVLAVASGIALRQKFSDLLTFGIGFCVGFVLLGSVEIYLNNLAVCGRPLGSESFVSSHANPDGLRGAMANVLRYLFGNVNLGLEFFGPNHQVYAWLPKFADATLRQFGLQGLGARGDFREGRSTWRLQGGAPPIPENRR